MLKIKTHLINCCSLAEDFVVLDMPSNDVLCNMLSIDAAGLYSGKICQIVDLIFRKFFAT